VQKNFEKEIKNLIEIAFKKGIEKAFNIAKKRHPYLIDEFHDRLIEEIKKRK